MTNNEWIEKIQQNLNNDSLRLAYADWLEEQGDPLGEFIRIQFQLSDMLEDHSIYKNLKRREDELLQKINRDRQIIYQKGLPYCLIMDYILGFDNKIIQYPTIKSLEIKITTTENFQNLINSEYFQKITNLKLILVDDPFNEFESREATNYLRILANSPNSVNLEHLNFNDNNINSYGLTALIESSYINKLKHLDVSNNNINNDGIIALANSKNIINLQHLNLDNNDIGNDGIITLANSPYIKNLKYLDISFNHFDNRGVNALVKSLNINLETLVFMNHKFAQVQKVINSPNIKNVIY